MKSIGVDEVWLDGYTEDEVGLRGAYVAMEIAELTSSGVLRLPPTVAEQFRAADRFVVWAEGDSLFLKRITKRSVTEIIADAPIGEPMELDEINDIVHEVRRRRGAK